MANPQASAATSGSKTVIHTLAVRITHWINAIAILIMILSGWRIYDASPLFNFIFPDAITLGGWLAGALQWHFAAMWLLVLNGLFYVCYGIVSGHFKSSFLPVTPRSVWREFKNALRGQISHELGVYNAVQRAAYIGVLCIGVVLVLSGLSIWKPVQFQELAALMGGYEGARVVHFVAMGLLVFFILVHLTLVALVPRTLWPMFSGRAEVS
ncbi:MAG TPA: cytochrome b/b6 domain-containing protein, partial [Burkholderiales bacterium]|nr:cytochrome b/b6 domain-containing protein [Burkholderiales bacterium]